MAKKHTQTIQIDVVTKGIETAEKAISGIDSSYGDLYKQSQKVSRAIEKIRNITSEYGENIPIVKAKELAKQMKIISEETAEMAEIDEIVVFNKKEIENLKKLETAIDNIHARIKQIKKDKVNIPVQMEQERIEELKTQKTAKNASGKSVSLDDLKNEDGSSKFNSKQDLIDLSKSADPKVAKAAEAALHQLELTAQKAAAKVQLLNEEYNKLSVLLQQKSAEYNELSTTIISLTDAEKANFDTVSKFTSELVKSIQAATEASQKQGEEFVRTSKAIDKNTNSVGRAVKQLFNWTTVWNLGKRMLKEAVRTVTEMDKALTGMAVVTDMSREEAQKLIPQIQSLSRETSTAMTDVANLITEYTKQGRNLEESFLLAETTAKAAKIAGISAAESVEYMTSAINGFNLAATESVRVSDIFANLAAVSATDYEQLAIALSKVSAQANLAGLSIEYTTALLAKGIETTQEAPESIGTALKTILARMRELSDYGKTLEDGASVNKVETALAAAGIELRDVNGEFRELEEIFNELGPKWAKLNTMQQQAIAQAVAGTRQQSRFVAIMQDWERTQQLAAQAQDSAGATAAQYAEQAKGLEAAMTNLTTAWQTFIQSLTSSKFVITVINLATKLLDGLDKVLSAGGEFTKSFAAGLISVIAVAKTLHKIENIRKAISNVIKANSEEEVDAAEQVTEAKKKALEYEKSMLQLKLKGNESALNNAYKAEEKLTAEESLDDDAYTAVYIRQDELLREQVALKEQIKMIDSTINQDTSGAVQLEYDLRQRMQMMLQESQAAELAKLDAQIAANEALQQELNIEEQRILYEQQITQEKIKQLEAQLAMLDANDSKTLSQRLSLESQISELKSTETRQSNSLVKIDKQKTKLTKTNNKLEQKRGKIINGEVKDSKKLLATGKQLANKILKKMGVDTNKISKGWDTIKGLFGGVKTLGDQNNINLNKLLDGEKQRIKNYDDILASGKIITEDGKEMALEEDVRAKILERRAHAEENVKNIQAAQKDLGVEGLVNQQQANQLLNIEQATQQGILVTEEGHVAAEGAENAQVVAGLPAETAEAAANIATSASQPYGVGMPFAIAGIGLLAAVGLGAGLAGLIANAKNNSDAAKTERIAESQSDIYDKKKANAELSSNAQKYEALYSKQNRTEEEEDELKELESSIHGLDETLENKTGDQLLKAMNSLQIQNKASINAQTKQNYETALSMKDLSAALVGDSVVRQAINDELLASQRELIESNYVLANSTATDAAAVEQAVSKMNDAFTDQLGDYEKELEEYFYRNSYYNSDMGYYTLVENGSYKTYSTADEYSSEKIDELKEHFAQASVNFAIKVESAGDNLGKQLSAYSSALITEGISDIEKIAIDANYQTLRFMNEMSDINTTSGQNFTDIITRLSEVDQVSAAAITEITDSILRLRDGNDEDYNLLVDVKGNLDEKAADVSFDRYGKTWRQWAEEFGLDPENFSFQELYEAYREKYYDNSGDEWTGDWMGNDERAKKVDAAMKEMAEAELATETAGFNAEQIKAKNELSKDLITNLPQVIAEAFESMQADLGITAGMTNEEINALDISKKTMAQAYYGMQDELYGYIENEYGEELNKSKTKTNDLYKQIEKARLAGDKAKVKSLNEELNSHLKYQSTVQQMYDEAYTNVRNSIRSAAGYLDSGQFDNKSELAVSAKDTITDLKEKVLAGELGVEDYEKLQSEVLPALRKQAAELGQEFDADKLMQEFAKGSLTGLKNLTQYFEYSQNQTIDELETALVGYENQIQEEQDIVDKKLAELNAAKATGNQDAINIATAEYETAVGNLNATKNTLAVKKDELELVKKSSTLGQGMTAEELKRYNIEQKLNALDEESLSGLKNKIDILKQLYNETNSEMDTYYKKMSDLGLGSVENIKKNIKVIDGTIQITEEWYDKLTDEEKWFVDQQLEGLREIVEANKDAYDQMSDTIDAYYTHQIDAQSELIEVYKSKLESEQEALQNSLDKRKEMYEKYFDSLEEQESDETFEEEQARLRKAITALSSSSDATSLTKLKEYQEQLKELEDEQLQTERDRRREATMANLDNQSEAIDQYYEDRLENEQELWNEISKMSKKGIEELMTKYNEDYKNATELNQSYMLLSYKQLHADVMAMMGNTEAATKATADYENYKRWMEKYADDPTIGKYDSKKSYSTDGIVDYTGLAMVHGSTSHPKAFLNASQTAMFAQLSKNLEAFYSHSSGYSNLTDDNNSVAIENFTIAVDATLTDNNVRQTGESLADALLEGLRRTGISVNMKK